MGQANAPAGRGLTALAVAVSVVSGAFVALQSRINGEFGLALGNGALAALIFFSTGLTLISLAMLASPSGRAGLVALQARAAAGEHSEWGEMLPPVAVAFAVLPVIWLIDSPRLSSRGKVLAAVIGGMASSSALLSLP